MEGFREYDQYDGMGLADLVRRGEVSASQLLNEALRRLDHVNADLNAVICDMEILARQQAGAVRPEQLFCGLPFLIKDLMLPMAGYPMSNGSRWMQHWQPDEHAPMAQAMLDAGLVPFGKTNTSELGTSPLTSPEAFGPTLNPWNTALNAGGSSGGSAAAVAARIVPMAWGSDGGGSIRVPASYCGIFGFKPSRGANRFDQAAAWEGAVTNHLLSVSVRDSALWQDWIAGRVTSAHQLNRLPEDSSLRAALTSDISPRRIALITESPINTRVHEDCIHAARDAARRCESMGHHVEAVSWPYDGMVLMRAFITVVLKSTWQDLLQIRQWLGADACSDGSGHNMPGGAKGSRRAGRKDKPALETMTLAMANIGSTISDQDYQNALQVWRDTSAAMECMFEQYDLILTPVTATPPVKSSELSPLLPERWLLSFLNGSGLYRHLYSERFLDKVIQKSTWLIPFTAMANIGGFPAMSLPLYWNADALPVGVQFMAGRGRDNDLLSLAAIFEQEMPWRDKHPIVSAVAG